MIEIFPELEQVDSSRTALREYNGFIWIEDDPGLRLRIWANTLEEADQLVSTKFGDGHVVSIWNEEDAHKLR